jgi:hypothetical protein
MSYTGNFSIQDVQDGKEALLTVYIKTLKNKKDITYLKGAIHTIKDILYLENASCNGSKYVDGDFNVS